MPKRARSPFPDSCSPTGHGSEVPRSGGNRASLARGQRLSSRLAKAEGPAPRSWRCPRCGGPIARAYFESARVARFFYANVLAGRAVFVTANDALFGAPRSVERSRLAALAKTRILSFAEFERWCGEPR